MIEQENGCQTTNRSRFKMFFYRIKEHYFYRFTREIAFWLEIKFKLYGIDTPEYFKAHPFLVRWLGGINQFCHTHWCGHGFKFSFHIANIYWKIGGEKIDQTNVCIGDVPMRMRLKPKDFANG